MFFHLSPYFYFLFSKFSVLYFPPLNLTFFHFKHPSLFASPLFSALHLFRAVLPKDKYLDVLGCWESFYSDWVLFPKVFIILPLLSAFISSKKQTQKKKHFARPQPPGCLWPKIKFPLGNIFPSIWDTVSGSALESLEANGSCFPACNPLRVGTKRYQLSLFLVKETLLILDTFRCMFKLTINYSLIIDKLKVHLLFQEENVELQSELLLWELFTLYVFIAIWTSSVA